MLLFALGAVLIPLSRALSQLTQELVARGAVEEAVKMVVGDEPDAIISRQTYLQTDTIPRQSGPCEPGRSGQSGRGRAQHFAAHGPRGEAKRPPRCGEEELQRLREGLVSSQTVSPTDIESIRADLMARLQRPLEELWPEESACLEDYRIAFTKKGIIVTVGYEAELPLDETTREVLARGLQSQLGLEDLQLELEGQVPPE